MIVTLRKGFTLFTSPFAGPDASLTPTTHPRICRLDRHELTGPAPLVFTKAVVDQIQATVGSLPAESGGMLGGTRGSGVVDQYVFDTTASRTAVTYYPDHEKINALLREDWNPRGINLLGFVHSHPAGNRRPSRPDLDYATRILGAIPELDRFVMPIVQTAPDTGKFSMHGFTVTRGGSGVGILQDVEIGVETPRGPVDPGCFLEFDRVREAYDLPSLAASRIVAVGCGGSAGFLEDMARAGVGEFVLIDPDDVDLPNVGTQQVYGRDLGVPKVEAIARRLVAVSPHVRVWTLRAPLDRSLNDRAMRRLCQSPLPGSGYWVPATTLLCAFTDDFWAQARVSRLGLQFGLPVLGATVYREGRGIELTFSAPGITPACIRCALGSRYRAYLDQGFKNDVGSRGTPIWATARLNSLKQPVALALLQKTSRLRDTSHPSFERTERFLSAVGDKNLVMVGLDPDICETLQLSTFGRIAASTLADDLAFDTALWRRQTPDTPDNGWPYCPDCGGTGDLSDSIGRLSNTADLPRVLDRARTPGKATRKPRTNSKETR